MSLGPEAGGGPPCRSFTRVNLHVASYHSNVSTRCLTCHPHFREHAPPSSNRLRLISSLHLPLTTSPDAMNVSKHLGYPANRAATTTAERRPGVPQRQPLPCPRWNPCRRGRLVNIAASPRRRTRCGLPNALRSRRHAATQHGHCAVLCARKRRRDPRRAARGEECVRRHQGEHQRLRSPLAGAPRPLHPAHHGALAWNRDAVHPLLPQRRCPSRMVHCHVCV